MKPSEVRDHVGHEHIQLRILFAEVEGTCREALFGACDPRTLIQKLVRSVSDHLTMEERLLIPALRAADRRGSVRAERVVTEHAEQRKQLAQLRALARQGSIDDAARAALDLIAELIADMNAEEADLLNPNLLRDDPIVISQSEG